jgi:uncharacterized membrane protein YgaE (UPF0421/DUF939 family)
MTLRVENRTVVKIAVAAGLAWWLGNLAGQARPVFAAIVPIVVIRMDSADTIRGSLGRVLGVIIGVGIGLTALLLTRPSPLAVAIVVGTALIVDRFIGQIPRFGVDTRNQAAVSALLMLFVATRVTSFALARVWETALGAGIALLVEVTDEQFRRHLGHGRMPRTS